MLNGRGFLLLRGLPVERWSMREAATAFFGLGAHLGSARSQNGKGHASAPPGFDLTWMKTEKPTSPIRMIVTP